MNRTSIDDEQPQRARQDEANGVRPGKRVRRPEGGQSFDLARMRELGRNLGGQLQAQARKRPYMMLGAAAGIGFVAGSLFGSRLGQVAIAAAVGYFARNVLEGEMGEPIRHGFEKLAQQPE